MLDEYFPIPDWDILDITPIFDFLWQILVGLWEWSGDNGFMLYDVFVAYRYIIIVGLIIAVFISRLLGDYESEIAEAIAEYSQKI